jgi:hypothetical protein
MFSLKVITVALALGSATTTYAASGSPLDASGGGRAERINLLSTWWYPEPATRLVFTWSQSGEVEGLRFTWWKPAEAPRLTFAFSVPRALGDLALTWSRPDQGRDLLYTWSHLPMVEEEGEGSASGEPTSK